MISVSYTHLDVYKRQEEENVVMDENDDYELKNIEMGRKEEEDISDRLRKMVGKCKRIYSCLLYTSRCV